MDGDIAPQVFFDKRFGRYSLKLLEHTRKVGLVGETTTKSDLSNRFSLFQQLGGLFNPPFE